ncbi:MAG: hypothetical protein AB7H80_12530 [Candidatus Kapaibacterium sp.]
MSKLNIALPSFNDDFCTQLEYHLCRAFQNSDREDLRGFWCDGISPLPASDTQLTKEYVNDNRKLVTTGWIGKSGQDEYEVTIYFGKDSLRRYANGGELADCIPSDESTDWVDIDTHDRTVEFRLRIKG